MFKGLFVEMMAVSVTCAGNSTAVRVFGVALNVMSKLLRSIYTGELRLLAGKRFKGFGCGV